VSPHSSTVAGWDLFTRCVTRGYFAKLYQWHWKNDVRTETESGRFFFRVLLQFVIILDLFLVDVDGGSSCLKDITSCISFALYNGYAHVFLIYALLNNPQLRPFGWTFRQLQPWTFYQPADSFIDLQSLGPTTQLSLLWAII